MKFFTLIALTAAVSAVKLRNEDDVEAEKWAWFTPATATWGEFKEMCLYGGNFNKIHFTKCSLIAQDAASKWDLDEHDHESLARWSLDNQIATFKGKLREEN